MRVLIGVIAAGLLGLAGFRHARAVADKPGLVQVNVRLQCVGDSMDFAVSPWTARLKQNDSIDWTLDTAANADSLVISAKNPSDWPFADGTVYHGNKHRAAGAQGMKAKAARPSPYQYTILAMCPGPDGTHRTLVIDPDMIIQ